MSNRQYLGRSVGVAATSRRGDTGTAPGSISDEFAALPAKSAGRAGAESSDAVAAVLERSGALYIVENVVAPSEEAPESERAHSRDPVAGDSKKPLRRT